jgi:hypothetical protein
MRKPTEGSQMNDRRLYTMKFQINHKKYLDRIYRGNARDIRLESRQVASYPVWISLWFYSVTPRKKNTFNVQYNLTP